jgi:uncharacterized protein (DUF2062 family)
LQAQKGLFQRQPHFIKRPVVRLKERALALAAAVALKAMPIFPEFLALGLAIMTGQFGPCFLRTVAPK